MDANEENNIPTAYDPEERFNRMEEQAENDLEFFEDLICGYVNCPHCADVGFIVVYSFTYAPEQQQCQFCYETPNSKFNLDRRGVQYKERKSGHRLG